MLIREPRDGEAMADRTQRLGPKSTAIYCTELAQTRAVTVEWAMADVPRITTDDGETERHVLSPPIEHALPREYLQHLGNVFRAFTGRFGEANRKMIDDLVETIFSQRLTGTPDIIWQLALVRFLRYGDGSEMLEAWRRGVPLSPDDLRELGSMMRRTLTKKGKGEPVPVLALEAWPDPISLENKLRLGLEVRDELHDGEKKVDLAVEKVAKRNGWSKRHVYKGKALVAGIGKYADAMRKRYEAASAAAAVGGNGENTGSP